MSWRRSSYVLLIPLLFEMHECHIGTALYCQSCWPFSLTSEMADVCHTRKCAHDEQACVQHRIEHMASGRVLFVRGCSSNSVSGCHTRLDAGAFLVSSCLCNTHYCNEDMSGPSRTLSAGSRAEGENRITDNEMIRAIESSANASRVSNVVIMGAIFLSILSTLLQ